MLATLRGAVSLAALLLLAKAALAAEDVTAITTPGQGNLTMCPMMGCNLYHHIKLPLQIAVGDRVHVRFGSNVKRYYFPVARIVRDGTRCTVYSQLTDMTDVEKIEVASCGAPPAAQ